MEDMNLETLFFVPQEKSKEMAIMKVIACLLLFIILIVPSDSTARLQDETTKLLDGIENNWPEANLRTWTSAEQTKAFKLGDEIKFHFL